MDFDNIISNALKHENDLYLKKYSNSLFRISKRDKSRLELTCRYDKTCKYLIRCKKSAGIVTFHKKHQLHTCSIKDSIKPTAAAKVDLEHSILYYTHLMDYIIFNRKNAASKWLKL